MNNNQSSKPWGPWTSDQGDGYYRNPVLHADYSDPDIIRVGEDFYLTASSFGHLPGLPILHSKDLVNWRLINHAIPSMPLPNYDAPQHGNGVWAPSLRYHEGKYWIFYGDPDVGIFMTTADDPAGEWSALHLVQEGKGLIDACPFWDDDGQAYLVHAYANSRSGIKHRLRVCRMAPDGTRLLDEGVIIIDDPESQPTIEGPKMYKRNGYYYIFAPAGGVEEGWQTVLRSPGPLGPYELRIVMQQGTTPINGPHQGGWVELSSGESWFMHFQHKDAYGRIVHLQPMVWQDDWPLIGDDIDGDGIGEPVLKWTKPNVGGECSIEAPAATDEFDGERLGLQWQWQANPRADWYSLQERPGYLRLYAQAAASPQSTLFQAPHLLLQKFPAYSFSATTVLDAGNLEPGSRAGLLVFGYRYAGLIVRRDEQGDGYWLQIIEGDAAGERIVCQQEFAEFTGKEVVLRVDVAPEAWCSFGYRIDGTIRNEGTIDGKLESMEHDPFQATVSKWVGAKVGLFAQAAQGSTGGSADFRTFLVAEGSNPNL